MLPNAERIPNAEMLKQVSPPSRWQPVEKKNASSAPSEELFFSLHDLVGGCSFEWWGALVQAHSPMVRAATRREQGHWLSSFSLKAQSETIRGGFRATTCSAAACTQLAQSRPTVLRDVLRDGKTPWRTRAHSAHAAPRAWRR